MSSISPSPNSPVTAADLPPPQPSSPPPIPQNSPSPANTTSPPPPSPGPPLPSQPPTPSPPQFEFASNRRVNASQPPSSPPPNHPSKPPPSSPPPASSPPAPPPTDRPKSPPPPSVNPPPPPNNSPPPPTKKKPPESSPPPPTPAPKNPPPPPPPSPKPPEPPPPPPPLSKPPQSSPPSPPLLPPPPPIATPPPSRSPPAATPPPSNYPSKSLPPTPIKRTASPPPPPSVLSPPSRSRQSPSVSPSGVPSRNGSSVNVTRNPQSGNRGSGAGGTVVVLVLLVMVLGIFATVACCVWKRKRKASGYNGGYVMPAFLGSSQEADSALLKVPKLAPIIINGNGSAKSFVYSPRTPGGFGNPKTWFAYEELVEATNDFSAENLLGEGGFGSVYKGSLADGRDVAVKQLKIGGSQGDREFRSEVEIISRIHHRHLVSLVGYCIYGNKRLLVYDYVPNNNLYFHLHSEGRPIVDWVTRVKIAIGAARGIAYLHEDCHPRIIHRDIKSSNILIDNNFEARVSDFGLAKLAIDANSHVTTRVMGTFGYMAPEYASSGKLTEKSDVYSYGVVLLELITGRKPVDTTQPLGEESLVEWARPLLSRAIETHDLSALADPRLELRYVDYEMFRMIEAAAACVRHSSARRPKMGQVARALDCMDMGDLSNGMKVGESGMFNCAHESEEIRLFRKMAFGCQDYSTGYFRQDCWISEGDRVNSRRQMIQ